jgi:hypothetical protein
VIRLIRDNRFVAAIVTLLIAVSAAGMSLTTGRGPQEHSPVMELAVLPAATRLQTGRRYAAVSSIRLRLVRRLRESRAWRRRLGLNRRPRLPVHEWYARGPPR